jgi:hypothetical protein
MTAVLLIIKKSSRHFGARVYIQCTALAALYVTYIIPAAADSEKSTRLMLFAH